MFSKYWNLLEYTVFVSKTDCPSDLTDDEWAHLEPLLPVKSGGRPRAWSLRLTVNGIFYLLCTGCAWRQLPQDYPLWQTVYTTFRRWKQDGTWEPPIPLCGSRSVSPWGVIRRLPLVCSTVNL